ncbi:hypothetical protein [Thalassotalea castellviae]|uniref:DUF2897 family protein n=1 Tax=Thalassotalea castellviae TaxID=3075612 RepID=A0ABU2ZY73_9GAMM|nr:hypothetical protein [Thalassotalea sp. W431]MDT0602583.1 hypothetical protein [Thalassotalea sp. W431]
MEYYREFFIVLSPCLILGFLAIVAKMLISAAKSRKGIAVAFGVMAQMLLPDPQVEKTIDTIIVAKRKVDEQEEQKDNKTG